MAYHTTLNFKTEIDDVVRIDDLMQNLLNEPKVGITTGIITAFVPGSTGAISTIEFESGLISDFPRILHDLVPKNNNYKHNKLNYDDNGHSHIKSTIIGPSITIPFVNKKMKLGTWQQVVFIEFDTHPRNRTIEIMVL